MLEWGLYNKLLAAWGKKYEYIMINFGTNDKSFEFLTNAKR